MCEGYRERWRVSSGCGGWWGGGGGGGGGVALWEFGVGGNFGRWDWVL